MKGTQEKVIYEDEREKGEKCQKCDKRYPYVWATSNDLWQKITNKETGGLYCVTCFDKMAREKGIYLNWEAK